MTSGLLTASLVNRALGPAGRGVYAEMQTWIGLFMILFGMSVDSAIYHYANRSIYGEDDNSKFITVLYLTLAQSLIGGMGLVIFVRIDPSQVSSQTTQFLPYLIILLISSMITANLTVFIQALGKIKFSAVIGVMQAGVSVLIIGYGYLTEALDLFYAVWCLISVQTITVALFALTFLKRGLNHGHFCWNVAKSMIKSGGKQHIGTIASFVYTKINQLIIFKYWGDSETGIFAVALSAAFYLMFVPMAFQTVLYPRVIHSTDDHEVTIRSLRFGFYGWGCVVALIIVFAEPILLIYGGREFLRAVTPFRILMIAAWFLPLSSLIAPYCVKIGAFYAMTATALILGLISVMLNFLLIPKFSATGAALATAATCALGFCLSLFLLGYLSKKSSLGFIRVRIP